MASCALRGSTGGFHHLPGSRDQESPLAGRGPVQPRRDDPAKQDRCRPSDHPTERRCNGGAGAAAGTSAGAGSNEPEHYVFPTCEQLTIDPTRPQKSWRTAWRKLVRETAQAGRKGGRRKRWKRARGSAARSQHGNGPQRPFRGLRFHDLRHQAITEMAEAGASDATADGRCGSHVPADAGALQPRAHGRKAHGAGQAGKRSDGRALGRESTRSREGKLSELRHNPRHKLLPPQSSSVCIFLNLMVGATGLEPVTSCV